MKNKRRRDIQGLRAVAVVVVVLNHLMNWPRGGFVGVDVFFVISGYLITGLLLRDIDRDRSIVRNLGRFYVRRVRRILPAALVVTAGTVLAAHALMSTPRFDDTLHDAGWATAFLANVHFADVGTQYFTATLPPSPFQHYWSLSVEEQFYLLWPLLLLTAIAVVALAGRTRVTANVRRVTALLLIGGLSAVSLVIALRQTASAPVTAYFATPARAWELGLGAAVACAQPWLRMPRRLAACASVVGLGTIAVSLFVIDSASPFPAPGALLPCIGAALCVGAVAYDGGGARNKLLTNPSAVYIGDISYSVYLVHFPVIVLLETRLPEGSNVLDVAALLLTAGLSVLLHVVIERPFMTGRRPRVARPRDLSGPLLRIGAGAAVALLGLAVLTVAPDQSVAESSRLAGIRSALGATQPVLERVGPKGRSLDHELRSALRRDTWPDLHPSIDQELGRQPVPGALDQCGSITLQPARTCTIGRPDAPNTAYLVGDSTAMAYVAGYQRILAQHPAWNLRIGAAYGCSFDSVVLANEDPNVVAHCASHNAAVLRDMARVRPRLVLVTNTYTGRADARTNRVLSSRQWSTALTAQLSRMPGEPRVAIVEPAPDGIGPYECYRPGGTPSDCVYQVSAEHLQRARNEAAIADRDHMTFVPTEAWFCDQATGYCPMFARGVPIKHDDVHASFAYVRAIAPVMAESLLRAGVLTHGGRS